VEHVPAHAAAIARHPHLAEAVPRGWVRVDMHSHTMWSGDSTTTPDEIVDAVTSTAIDVLCITDHHAIRGATELAERLTCAVVVGEEVRTHSGELIGLFLTERVPAGLPAAETAQRIRDQGGLVYVPHPFDPMRRNLDAVVLAELAAAGLVDCIEGVNAKTSLRSLNQRATDFAGEHDLAVGAGSDAHVPLAIAAAVVDMPDFTDAPSFLRSLRQGIVRGHHWDEARPWSSRVLPSVSTN
jgi:predicted metal-dependent phosphoesterase TrpH